MDSGRPPNQPTVLPEAKPHKDEATTRSRGDDRRADPALVVVVSLLDPSGDYDEQVTFLGREVRIIRAGTSGRVEDARALVSKWSAQAQAIAVTGVREARATGRYEGDLRSIEVLHRATPGVPVTHGGTLRNVLQEWAVRHVQTEMPGYFNNARVVVLGRGNHEHTTRILREYTANITLAEDPPLLDLLSGFETIPVVGQATNAALWPAHRLPGRVQSMFRRRARSRTPSSAGPRANAMSS